MAVFGMAITVCFVLAKKYPDGYLLEDLFDEAKGTAPWLLSVDFLERTVLGSEDGRPHINAMISCWNLGDDGKVYFDPSAERYSNYDNERFKETIEKWFVSQGLEKRRLNPGD